jgi:transcriptional regulator with XRE-family HTH domain
MDGAGTRDQAERRAELGAFLRTRRAAVRPADVGLPEGTGRRRTPGLRREEVAQLSGVGIAWYTWLEQGRVTSTSAQVIDALARALRLDDEAYRHLRYLAGLPLPPVPVFEGTPDHLQRVVDNLVPNPAYVLDRRFDYRTWNRAYTAVWRDLDSVPESHRNLLWLFFTDPGLRDLVSGWESRAQALLAQFRTVAGRYPGDARLRRLASDLSDASPRFRQWWADYTVGGFTAPDHAIIHPVAGRIAFDLTQLRIVQYPALTLVLQTPRASADQQALGKLVGA